MTESWMSFKSGGLVYEVSNKGRVRRYLRPFKSVNSQYLQIYLAGSRKQFVHVLVAALFIGPKPAGLIVDHKDNNGLNADVRNLQYITQHANIRKNKHTKMTPIKVRELRRLHLTKTYNYEQLGKLFGITGHQASVITRGIQWGDVTD